MNPLTLAAKDVTNLSHKKNISSLKLITPFSTTSLVTNTNLVSSSWNTSLNPLNLVKVERGRSNINVTKRKD